MINQKINTLPSVVLFDTLIFQDRDVFNYNNLTGIVSFFRCRNYVRDNFRVIIRDGFIFFFRILLIL